MVSPEPSPPRRVLHDRPESHINKLERPSIRLVQNADIYATSPGIYSTSPYPSQPAHVLPPNDATVPVSGKNPSTSFSHFASRLPPPRSDVSGPRTPKAPKTRDALSSVAARLYDHESRSNLPRTPRSSPPRADRPPPPRGSPPTPTRPSPPRASRPSPPRAQRAYDASSTSRGPGGELPRPPIPSRYRPRPSRDFPPNPSVTDYLAEVESPIAALRPLALRRDGGDPFVDRPPSRSGPASHHGTYVASFETSPPSDPSYRRRDPAPFERPTLVRPSFVSGTSSAYSDTWSEKHTDSLGSLSQKTRSRRPSASYSAFPAPTQPLPKLPSPGPSTAALPSPGSLIKTSRLGDTPPSPHPDSPDSSRSGSPPSYIQPSPAIRPGGGPQPPFVQPPASLTSWARQSISLPKRPPVMARPSFTRSRHWSNDLSTVHSESERTSGSLSPARNSEYGSVIASIIDSSDPKSDESESLRRSIALIPDFPVPQTGPKGPPRPAPGSPPRPPPRSPPRSPPRPNSKSPPRPNLRSPPRPTADEPRSRPLSKSEEFRDALGKLPKLPWSRASYSSQSASQNASQETSSTVKRTSRSEADPDFSRGSFLNTGLPAWVKAYYGSGAQIPLEDTSEEGSEVAIVRRSRPIAGHPSYRISRPRTRPPEVALPRDESPSQRPLPEPEAAYDPRFTFRESAEIWSPRLHPNRRTTRYSMWEMPQIPPDKVEEEGFIARMGGQMIFFCVGFIFPIAWMIGALWPLPPNPQSPSIAGKSRSSQSDLEKVSVNELRYLTARWWRTVNRIMSVIGILLIGAIVALLVVALHIEYKAVPS
ncbi:MAG: hypothetical protein M1838_006067 [Thelocarpon superellum]|nr:MAG: hypothetical protein M1838_006067 [Thelocarpon superellum]